MRPGGKRTLLVPKDLAPIGIVSHNTTYTCSHNAFNYSSYHPPHPPPTPHPLSALQGMRPGGKRTLLVPKDLALKGVATFNTSYVFIATRRLLFGFNRLPPLCFVGHASRWQKDAPGPEGSCPEGCCASRRCSSSVRDRAARGSTGLLLKSSRTVYIHSGDSRTVYIQSGGQHTLIRN